MISSVILLRDLIRRHRLKAVTLGVVVLLGLLVVWEHSGGGAHEMAGDMGAMLGGICLAVAVTFRLPVAPRVRRIVAHLRRPIHAAHVAVAPDAPERWVRPPPRLGAAQLQVFLR